MELFACSERYMHMKEELEDTKGVIRIRISKKNRQNNGQMKKDNRTNNDLQNISIKLTINVTNTEVILYRFRSYHKWIVQGKHRTEFFNRSRITTFFSNGFIKLLNNKYNFWNLKWHFHLVSLHFHLCYKSSHCNFFLSDFQPIII